VLLHLERKSNPPSTICVGIDDTLKKIGQITERNRQLISSKTKPLAIRDSMINSEMNKMIMIGFYVTSKW
jgi:hypothetical protein